MQYLPLLVKKDYICKSVDTTHAYLLKGGVQYI